MAIILALDTATSVTSVALIKDGKPLAFRQENEINKASEVLAVFVQEILEETGLFFKDIQAIALSKGPGSYTGLRISTAYAKGLCYSLSIPLISYSTLQGMVFTFLHKNKAEEEAVLIPLIDARREEAYAGFYNPLGEVLDEDKNIIGEENMWGEWYDKRVYYFGNGAEKFRKYLPENNFVYISDIEVSATDIAELIEKKYSGNEFENLAYFEPNYIKEFYFLPKKKA